MKLWFILLLCGALYAAETHAAPLTALAFSPDGSVLAGAAGNKVLLLSPQTGEGADSLTWEGMRVVALAFQPRGALLAVGGGIPGEKGEVRLLDWRRKTWLGSMSANADLVTGVVFSPDGRQLAIASADQSARVCRIDDGGRRIVPLFSLAGHSGPVTSVAFSPDGKLVVTASRDRSVKVWSADDGRLTRSFGHHTDAVHCLAFRPTMPDRAEAPAYCATGGDDRSVRVWQPGIGRMVRIVRHHQGSVLALAFAPDGRSLFSAGQEGIVRQIEADSDTVLHEWRVTDDWIYSLAISPDGRTLATGDWAGKVRCQSAGVKEKR